MNKEELKPLGLTPEQTKAIHIIHKKDMHALYKKLGNKVDNRAKRQAIITMLTVLEYSDSLDKILLATTAAYYSESKNKQAQGIASTVGTPAPEQSQPAPENQPEEQPQAEQPEQPEKHDQEVTEQ